MLNQANDVVRSRRDFAFALYVVLLTGAFGRSLVGLLAEVLHSDLNSYIVLIPLVSIYFFYSERSRFSSDRRSSVLWALPPLIAGSIALFFVANHASDSFGRDDNRATLVERDGAEALGVLSKHDLADRILDRVAALCRP